MKKNILIALICFSLPICFISCHDNDLMVKNGVYRIADTDATITLGENNTLTVHGYDFTKMEKEVYEDVMIRLEQSKLPKGETISEERISEIRDSVDLTKQFLDQTVSYETQKEDGTIGIYVPVENSEFFFYAQYFPNNDSLVFDEHILKREDK